MVGFAGSGLNRLERAVLGVFYDPISLLAIVYRTMGSKHGPITRLMSPSDLGEQHKPFVFLDHFEAESSSFGGFGMHPHSGGGVWHSSSPTSGIALLGFQLWVALRQGEAAI